MAKRAPRVEAPQRCNGVPHKDCIWVGVCDSLWCARVGHRETHQSKWPREPEEEYQDPEDYPDLGDPYNLPGPFDGLIK